MLPMLKTAFLQGIQISGSVGVATAKQEPAPADADISISCVTDP